MARVFIPSQLREATNGQAEFDVAGTTVRQLVQALEPRFPDLRARLCRDGELTPALQVSVDGVFSRSGLDAKVRPQSEVHFLPVFGGG
jgi:molybdopterin synthase sulfur carrier subunit